MYTLYLSMSFIIMHFMAVSMESPKLKRISEERVREIVTNYIPKIKDNPFAKKDPRGFYSDEERKADLEAFLRLIKPEVDGGKYCEYGDRGILCADNKLFIVDLYKGTSRFLPIPGRIESDDTKQAAISAIACTKMLGAHSERILLGENSGRVLVVDSEKRITKTFGHVEGKVLSFACHPDGKQIAVNYTSTDPISLLSVPCLALSKAYHNLENAASNVARNRGSWAPIEHVWSKFATKPCISGIRIIKFEGDLCVTECGGTGALEKWKIEILENKPQLIKVEELQKTSTP